MALSVPRLLPVQAYPFRDLRHLFGATGPQEGVVEREFVVSQRAAGGANMSVDISQADQGVWIRGDDSPRQGVYHVYNDAVINVAIGAAHATLPRIDTVIVRVWDSSVIGGGLDQASVLVLPGAATAGATLANLSGKALLPNTALVLAFVLVPAAAGSIVNANIGAYKDPARPTDGAVAGAVAQFALGRPASTRPAARASTTTAQPFAGGASGAIAFSLEDYDTDQLHDTATNNSRMTARTPGLYRVSAGVAQNITSGGRVGLLLRKNGNVSYNTADVAPGALNTVVADLIALGVGDYVEAVYGNATGGSLSVTAASLALEWVGPTA